MKRKSSVLYVLTAGILWGCMGILVKTMNKGGFTSLEVAAFRSFITTIVMLAVMFFYKKEQLKIKWKDLWCFLGTGLLSVTFFNVCYFSCMQYATLSTAAILLYTAPSSVMVLSRLLFAEAFTKRKALALVMAFLGCVCVCGGWAGMQLNTMGILTGLGAGAGYALYSIFSRYALQRGYSSFTITMYTFLFSFLGIVPFLNLEHLAKCAQESWASLPFCALMTIIVTVIPYLFYTKGLEGLENALASILASVEPVMASLVGVFLYREAMGARGVLGMLLVVGSCVLAGMKASEPSEGNRSLSE